MSSEVAQSLERSVALAERLEALLLDESGALAARNAESLHQVIALKEAAAQELEAETQRQQHWIHEAQLDFTPHGLQAFLARFENAPVLEAYWKRLRETLGRCERLNRDNADLIQRQRRRVDQSLRLLRGDDGVSTTYDPSGRTASAARSRTLSRA